MICKHFPKIVYINVSLCLVKHAVRFKGVNYHIAICVIKELIVYIKVLKPTIIMFMLSYISNSVNLNKSIDIT